MAATSRCSRGPATHRRVQRRRPRRRRFRCHRRSTRGNGAPPVVVGRLAGIDRHCRRRILVDELQAELRHQLPGESPRRSGHSGTDGPVASLALGGVARHVDRTRCRSSLGRPAPNARGPTEAPAIGGPPDTPSRPLASTVRSSGEPQVASGRRAEVPDEQRLARPAPDRTLPWTARHPGARRAGDRIRAAVASPPWIHVGPAAGASSSEGTETRRMVPSSDAAAPRRSIASCGLAPSFGPGSRLSLVAIDEGPAAVTREQIRRVNRATPSDASEAVVSRAHVRDPRRPGGPAQERLTEGSPRSMAKVRPIQRRDVSREASRLGLPRRVGLFHVKRPRAPGRGRVLSLHPLLHVKHIYEGP